MNKNMNNSIEKYADNNISDFIRHQRKVRKISQEKLAIELELSKKLIQRIEKGDNRILLQNVLKILNYFNHDLMIVRKKYQLSDNEEMENM